METKKLIKALIIDDESDICYLLSNILKYKNVNSRIAGSLSEARNILQTGDVPRIIFLDNNLPDGTGINFIKHLKKQWPSSKVVMITAFDTVSDRESARKQGADSFLGKPFSREMIYNLLDHFKV